MSKLSYDVFINDPPPQNDLLPNGEPKRFSPVREHAGEDIRKIIAAVWL